MKEAMKLALEEYLCREMPAGTVIGDPKWWAGKIANVLAKQEQGEPVASINLYELVRSAFHAGLKTDFKTLDFCEKQVQQFLCTTPYVPEGRQPKQEQGEPTGMLHIDRLDKWLDASLKERKQRTWVGLTDEEMWSAEGGGSDIINLTYAKAIEAKLKEKNT